jgi:hypothetical protein
MLAVQSSTWKNARGLPALSLGQDRVAHRLELAFEIGDQRRRDTNVFSFSEHLHSARIRTISRAPRLAALPLTVWATLTRRTESPLCTESRRSVSWRGVSRRVTHAVERDMIDGSRLRRDGLAFEFVTARQPSAEVDYQPEHVHRRRRRNVVRQAQAQFNAESAVCSPLASGFNVSAFALCSSKSRRMETMTFRRCASKDFLFHRSARFFRDVAETRQLRLCGVIASMPF